MNLPKRKQIRLEGYDYSSCGAYFITICTQNKCKILSNIVGDGSPVPFEPPALQLTNAGTIVENLINEISFKYAVAMIDKYVIMPNHIHLILQIIENNGTGNPSPTVGTIIAWLKYQATKQINLLNCTCGNRVFQRSFYDHIIRDECDYEEIWQYIDENPLKWEQDCFFE